MDNMKDLHELCETVSRAISTANEKIRAAGGKLSAGDSDYLDKLTHTLKSVKAVIAMEEAAEMDDGYSERGSYRGGMMRGYSNNDGYSRGYDNSYGPGRGRGSNARRDAMGRYSSDDGSYRGYSRGGNMVDELRELAENAPNEQVKQEIMRIIDKM